VKLSDIDSLAVELWVDATVRDGSGATTVIRCHGVLSGILFDTVNAKRLATNPAAGRGELSQSHQPILFETVCADGNAIADAQRFKTSFRAPRTG
jgi:hypothetical protein